MIDYNRSKTKAIEQSAKTELKKDTENQEKSLRKMST